MQKRRKEKKSSGPGTLTTGAVSGTTPKNLIRGNSRIPESGQVARRAAVNILRKSHMTDSIYQKLARTASHQNNPDQRSRNGVYSREVPIDEWLMSLAVKQTEAAA